MKKTTLALDIGSSKVVAVLAKNDNELNINILGTGISIVVEYIKVLFQILKKQLLVLIMLFH